MTKILGYIEAGKKEGARLITGGNRINKPGFYVEPTIFADCNPSMKIVREEIFGPVLICLEADTLDEAIQIVNQNPYGNGTAIFTNSGSAARKFQEDIDVGQVG